MAYKRERQDEGIGNAAVQSKLAFWWADLSDKDRRKMLSSVKEKPTLSNEPWEDLPEAVSQKLFSAGMMMKRLVKLFP